MTQMTKYYHNSLGSLKFNGVNLLSVYCYFNSYTKELESFE